VAVLRLCACFGFALAQPFRIGVRAYQHLPAHAISSRRLATLPQLVKHGRAEPSRGAPFLKAERLLALVLAPLALSLAQLNVAV
jgi:hypothetical protein